MNNYFADGSEPFGPRPIEEQIAIENQRAMLLHGGEIRTLMGTFLEARTDRRKHDRGCNLIGEQRRTFDRRQA